MKLNVFLVAFDRLQALKSKLESVGMRSVYKGSLDNWSSEFFFSSRAQPVSIPWAAGLQEELAEVDPDPKNLMNFGVYLWRTSDTAFAISFGKTFLYLADYCDRDFGLNMARRVGVDGDVRQKSISRYSGKRKKEIQSYQKNSGLDIQSGESVDYIQLATIDAAKWGKTAKFGSSMHLTLPISGEQIPDLLTRVQEELSKPPRFGLPITEVVSEEDEQRRYDDDLVASILGQHVSIEAASQQLVGVDFLFPGSETYTLRHYRKSSEPLDSLSVADLQKFISDYDIPRGKVLGIKVVVKREDAKSYAKPLKESLEFSIETEKVFLQNGHWVKFNGDYLTSINESVDRIGIDQSVEQELRLLDKTVTEPVFNEQLAPRFGYTCFDKNFSVIGLPNHKTEACDLIKGSTLYAVKFGKPQDFSYVCNQASSVVDILLNEPALGYGVPLENYCLWLIFDDRVSDVDKMSNVKSLILKQRLDDWARKCRNADIKPLLRIGYRRDSGLTTISE